VQTRTAELTESLEYQTATSDVLNVISRAPTQLQPVFDAIVETAARLCEAEYALVHMLRHGEYHMTAANNAAADYVRYVGDHPLAPERGSLVGRTALDARTIHVPDCLVDPEYTALGHQQAGGFRTMLGVPLLREDKAIGVILLMRNIVKPFSDRQIELVTTFADQAVIAIENVRLFGEVQARTEELGESLQQQTATAEVLKVISRSAFHLHRVLDTLAESAARLCEADIVTIWRPDGAVYRLAATYQITDEQRDYMEGVGHRPGRGSLVGRTLLEASVVHIHDTLEDSEYLMDVSRLREFRTQLGVPFLREGVPIGVIALIRRAVRPFTAKQIELATTFADQAVIAIENVRLFEEVQARTAELQESLEYQTATSDVLNVISRSPNELQPVLDAIVQTAAQLCSAEYAFIHRKADRARHDLRRSGGHRDRERAAVRGGAGAH
jgi:GAF domain-containing protein